VIIPITSNINQAEQSVRRVSDDAPKAVTGSLGGNAQNEQVSDEQVKKAADNISQAMKQANQNLEFEFSMDTDTKKTVVKVTDRQTGELVRQIPSEETVAIARSIDRFQRSLLLNQKA
jgi:flagellar protein FlaG